MVTGDVGLFGLCHCGRPWRGVVESGLVAHAWWGFGEEGAEDRRNLPTSSVAVTGEERACIGICCSFQLWVRRHRKLCKPQQKKEVRSGEAIWDSTAVLTGDMERFGSMSLYFIGFVWNWVFWVCFCSILMLESISGSWFLRLNSFLRNWRAW